MVIMKRTLRWLGPLLVLGVLCATAWILLSQAHFPWFQPAGVIAASEYKLLLFTVGLSVLVVIPVFTILGLFAWKYRESNTNAIYRPEWADSKRLEFIWWGIPVIIIAILAIFVWFTTHELDPYKKINANTATLRVQVVALQWKWLFIYPDNGVATVNELRLPVDTPVHFTLAADAPMSSFWVPSLGSQIYTMNGMSSQLNLLATKTGTYKGYNTNINGEGYAKMTFDVPVVSQSDFVTWTKKSAGSPSMMDEATYNDLARPSVISQQKTYMLMDKRLYDTIVMKYMMPKKSPPQSPADTQAPKTHDMSSGQHTMEGM